VLVKICSRGISNFSYVCAWQSLTTGKFDLLATGKGRYRYGLPHVLPVRFVTLGPVLEGFNFCHSVVGGRRPGMVPIRTDHGSEPVNMTGEGISMYVYVYLSQSLIVGQG
jgi:hypothetical protein